MIINRVDIHMHIQVMSVCTHVSFDFSGVIIYERDYLDIYYKWIFHFIMNCSAILQIYVPCAFPLEVHEYSRCSISSLTFGIVSFLFFSLFSLFVFVWVFLVTSVCSFNLHFL